MARNRCSFSPGLRNCARALSSGPSVVQGSRELEGMVRVAASHSVGVPHQPLCRRKRRGGSARGLRPAGGEPARQRVTLCPRRAAIARGGKALSMAGGGANLEFSDETLRGGGASHRIRGRGNKVTTACGLSLTVPNVLPSGLEKRHTLDHLGRDAGPVRLHWRLQGPANRYYSTVAYPQITPRGATAERWKGPKPQADSRMISSAGSITCWAPSCWPSINAKSILTASHASCARGWRIVVSGGSVDMAAFESSKPATATS